MDQKTLDLFEQTGEGWRDYLPGFMGGKRIIVVPPTESTSGPKFLQNSPDSFDSIIKNLTKHRELTELLQKSIVNINEGRSSPITKNEIVYIIRFILNYYHLKHYYLSWKIPESERERQSYLYYQKEALNRIQIIFENFIRDMTRLPEYSKPDNKLDKLYELYESYESGLANVRQLPYTETKYPTERLLADFGDFIETSPGKRKSRRRSRSGRKSRARSQQGRGKRKQTRVRKQKH